MTESRVESVASPEAVAPTSTGGLIVRLRTYVTQNKEFERFWKFAVVGGIGFVIDFSISNLMWAILPETLSISLPFNKSITYVGIGGAIGFLTAIISNFIWNRYWTYPDSRSKPLAGQFLMFLGINVAGILIRVPILEGLSSPLGRLVGNLFPGLGTAYLVFLSEGGTIWLGKNMALAISVVVVMFWNFFVNRYITYNDVSS